MTPAPCCCYFPLKNLISAVILVIMYSNKGRQTIRQNATVSTVANGCCTMRLCMGLRFVVICCSEMYLLQR